jgi:hypothetical protein
MWMDAGLPAVLEMAQGQRCDEEEGERGEKRRRKRWCGIRVGQMSGWCGTTRTDRRRWKGRAERLRESVTKEEEVAKRRKRRERQRG